MKYQLINGVVRPIEEPTTYSCPKCKQGVVANGDKCARCGELLPVCATCGKPFVYPDWEWPRGHRQLHASTCNGRKDCTCPMFHNDCKPNVIGWEYT